MEKLETESNAAASAPPVLYVAEQPTVLPPDCPPQTYVAPQQYPAEQPPQGN